MHATFRFGIDGLADLDLANGTWLAECGTPAQPALDDLRAAVDAVLAEPLSYPPLARSATPGDRVVLVLEQAVPQADAIVAGVVAHLLQAGVDPDGILVLRTLADLRLGVPDPCRLLSEDVRLRVTLLTHDPANRQQLAYLAAAEDGTPILLNRAIVEADVVLPVGCLGDRRAVDYHGIHAAVCPTFSDQRTLMRLCSPDLLKLRTGRRRQRLKFCNDVGWLLGVSFTIQVVPGPGEGVLHVLAGEVGAVRRRGRELYERAWVGSVPRRASLVVAALSGGAPRQTWHDVGRALAAATALVEEGGAIALCCDLAAEPGPAIRQLADSRSRRAALCRIRKDRPEDALAAMQLAGALDRAEMVYLLSRLDDALVEQLDMAPLARPAELARLARRHSSCIVLSNAGRAAVTAEAD
jgi:nickel-dependent lactate racemase